MKRAPFANRFDRRLFLVGAGGTLALPMLESLSPRVAQGQTVAAPKRLLLIHSQDGRLIGDGTVTAGVQNDWWSPAAATGALPAGMSPMLAALDPIRSEVVTFDGIDNLVRHTNCCETDQHMPAQKACLTCTAVDASDQVTAPSFDYVLGTRLRADASMRASLVMLGTASDYTWRAGNTAVFYGANGTSPTLVSPDPAQAIGDLFGKVMVGTSAPPSTPTLADRLVAQRKSVLDGVLGSFKTLRGRVNATDAARLDAHAEFIRALEQRATAPSQGKAGAGCAIPSAAGIPSNAAPNGGVYQRGEQDGALMPYIVENLVQTFACDVTRVASLFFFNGDDPIFPTQFPAGASPFQNDNWHTVIHSVPRIAENDQAAKNLSQSYGFYGSTFTQIVQRLAAITDVDGSRLLDNTLVLWVSEMGYGSVHAAHDVPVVMAGMKSAFPKGQGRHVVEDRRSMGDLFAHVLRLFGGDDQTFGDTGTIGDHNSGELNAGAGFPGYVTRDTPLHAGPLDL